MKYFLIFFVFAFSVFLTPIYTAYAETGGITLSPAFQEIVIEQEDEIQDFFVAVTNNTDAEVVLRLSVYDFGSLDESGGVAFLGASGDLEKKYALASWMRPEKDVLALTSGETGKIRVTIENRESLSPGGHYGALAFEAVDGSPSGDVAENNVAVKQLFSALVFVKKIGGEIYDLKLNGQEYQSNYFLFQDTVRLRFQNSGNVHITPRGIITITDPLGRVVAKGIINPESTLILPETLRVYPVKLNEIAKSFVPGRYIMNIAYRYDGNDNFAIMTSQFDFIPPVAIIVCLILIVLLVLYAIYWRRQKGGKRALFKPRKDV